MWVKILAGEVAEFIANSGVTVIGDDRILRAEVNSPMVVFDLRPQEIDGDFDPTIIQGFEPGSGGTIPEYVPSTAPSNTFAAVSYTHLDVYKRQLYHPGHSAFA